MVLKCSECGGEVEQICIMDSSNNIVVYRCTKCNKTIKKPDVKIIDMSGLEIIMEHNNG